MKKLLLGSASLCLFSLSIMLFQMSCKKDATAQTTNNSNNYILPPATTTTLGGVVVGNGLSVTGNGTLSTDGIMQLNKILVQFRNTTTASGEIWIANYDGSNYHKVNIVLPAGIEIQQDGRMSPDGQKIFFGASSTAGVINYIYSCNVDGTNVQQLLTANSNQEDFRVTGAY